MSFSVTMPALGESVSEGTVTRWLKNEGDMVAVDEPLLEVSTDKVDTEIPSPVAGILSKIVVGVDQTVAVGAELAVISDSAVSGGNDNANVAGVPAKVETAVEVALTPKPTQTIGSSSDLLESMGIKSDAPLCMTCGVKMRMSGACFVCEGCGNTSGCS